ncbi:efflux RND transporter periplasmic adaptor subunit [Flammeovirga yaeyamensis]|uniref:Efflux RND transporter periplasmic adaptor subunit n=1 Tax=Flammeovirga yaeyamensis TaxID=367791 RepID=A0AAX1NEX0_9BACT|nr:efflux RND transporter periplasmic adaptor subunit [Flammeovirga yaeyamensis]MBB3697009.1 RND family efflux transporter MFP subunit [Flammeovirga yaeyamensis]NMF33672.1 efflux RND transporter periplasmic adaptor subunit [Flammeovirga yaeyamensis]QWG05062.1 efflux RND transporter periplasmic adaptor subunit [Flammeovirga yaeyamensis]
MKKFILTFLFAPVMLSLFTGCSEQETEKKEIIRPVKLLTVANEGLFNSKTFPAKTKETKESTLAFRVGGPLVKLNAEVGQRIKKGQLIAQIDDRDFLVDLEAKKAKFIQARAEEQRFKGLLKKESIPQNEYDQKLAAFLVAKANYDDAQNALKDTKVYAPFNAVVSGKLVENYQEVRAKQGIVSLLDFSDTEVKFNIPESFVRFIDKVEEYKVTINAYPGKQFKASLKEVGAHSEDASGFPVYLYIDDAKKYKNTFPIGSGMTCNVEMKLKSTIDEDDFYLIPIHSIVQSKNENSVMVYDAASHTVKSHKVILGDLKGHDQVQVLSGIQAGDQIVEVGGHLLTEGQKVRVLDFNPTTSEIAKQ